MQIWHISLKYFILYNFQNYIFPSKCRIVQTYFTNVVYIMTANTSGGICQIIRQIKYKLNFFGKYMMYEPYVAHVLCVCVCEIFSSHC